MQLSRRPTPAAIAALTTVAILIGLVAAVAVAWSGGTRWFDVRTPSMGTTVPVGSLVVTEPVAFADIEIGDIVAFTRTASSSVYTHRVVARGEDWLETQGDENATPDPGLRDPDDVVGVMTHRLIGVGYLLRSLPILLAGILLASALSLLFARRYRPGVLLVGWSIAACVASAIHYPFFNIAKVTSTPSEGAVDVHLANVGLFPVRAQVEDGPHVDLLPGELGWVTATEATGADGAVNIAPTIHMSLGWWVLFVSLCCVPLLYALAVTYRGEPVRQGPGPLRVEGHTRRYWATTAVVSTVATVAMTVAAVLLNPANGAFMGRITNTDNTVATRTYFNCVSMLANSGTRYFAYGMRPNSTTWSTATNYEQDQSGNARHGTWARTGAASGANPTRTLSTHPCVRDNYSVVNIPAARWSATMGTGTGVTTNSPHVFTIETWFKTTNVNQKIVGFGTGTVGSESQYDRHLYIGSGGKLYFGIYPGGVQVISTPGTVNDNQWHHAVATLSTAGMVLYLDGAQVAQNTGVTLAEVYSGQWRIGYGNMAGWTDITNGPVPFNGSIGFTSVAYTAINAAEVKARFLAGAP